MTTIYIGLDPGMSGGLAAILGDDVSAIAMPDSELGILTWVLDQAARAGRTVAVIEQVTGWVGGGLEKEDGEEKRGAPGATMFKFGKNAGKLEMAMVAAGLVEGETFYTIVPRSWQKTIGVQRAKGEAKGDFKRRLKAEAARLFPQVTPTLKTADAILLAEVGRRRFS